MRNIKKKVVVLMFIIFLFYPPLKGHVLNHEEKGNKKTDNEILEKLFLGKYNLNGEIQTKVFSGQNVVNNFDLNGKYTKGLRKQNLCNKEMYPINGNELRTKRCMNDLDENRSKMSKKNLKKKFSCNNKVVRKRNDLKKIYNSTSMPFMFQTNYLPNFKTNRRNHGRKSMKNSKHVIFPWMGLPKIKQIHLTSSPKLYRTYKMDIKKRDYTCEKNEYTCGVSEHQVNLLKTNEIKKDSSNELLKFPSLLIRPDCHEFLTNLKFDNNKFLESPQFNITSADLSNLSLNSEIKAEPRMYLRKCTSKVPNLVFMFKTDCPPCKKTTSIKCSYITMNFTNTVSTSPRITQTTRSSNNSQNNAQQLHNVSTHFNSGVTRNETKRNLQNQIMYNRFNSDRKKNDMTDISYGRGIVYQNHILPGEKIRIEELRKKYEIGKIPPPGTCPLDKKFDTEENYLSDSCNYKNLNLPINFNDFSQIFHNSGANGVEIKKQFSPSNVTFLVQHEIKTTVGKNKTLKEVEMIETTQSHVDLLAKNLEQKAINWSQIAETGKKSLLKGKTFVSNLFKTKENSTISNKQRIGGYLYSNKITSKNDIIRRYKCRPTQSQFLYPIYSNKLNRYSSYKKKQFSGKRDILNYFEDVSQRHRRCITNKVFCIKPEIKPNTKTNNFWVSEMPIFFQSVTIQNPTDSPMSNINHVIRDELPPNLIEVIDKNRFKSVASDYTKNEDNHLKTVPLLNKHHRRSAYDMDYNKKLQNLQKDLLELQNALASAPKSSVELKNNDKNLTLQIRVIVDVVNNSLGQTERSDEELLKKRDTALTKVSRNKRVDSHDKDLMTKDLSGYTLKNITSLLDTLLENYKQHQELTEKRNRNSLRHSKHKFKRSFFKNKKPISYLFKTPKTYLAELNLTEIQDKELSVKITTEKGSISQLLTKCTADSITGVTIDYFQNYFERPTVWKNFLASESTTSRCKMEILMEFNRQSAKRSCEQSLDSVKVQHPKEIRNNYFTKYLKLFGKTKKKKFFRDVLNNKRKHVDNQKIFPHQTVIPKAILFDKKGKQQELDSKTETILNTLTNIEKVLQGLKPFYTDNIKEKLFDKREQVLQIGTDFSSTIMNDINDSYITNPSSKKYLSKLIVLDDNPDILVNQPLGRGKSNKKAQKTTVSGITPKKPHSKSGYVPKEKLKPEFMDKGIDVTVEWCCSKSNLGKTTSSGTKKTRNSDKTLISTTKNPKPDLLTSLSPTQKGNNTVTKKVKVRGFHCHHHHKNHSVLKEYHQCSHSASNARTSTSHSTKCLINNEVRTPVSTITTEKIGECSCKNSIPELHNNRYINSLNKDIKSIYKLVENAIALTNLDSKIFKGG